MPPGADRFWGQMSKAGAKRGKSEEEPAEETNGASQDGHGHQCLEWCPICRSVELLGTATSPEVRQQIQAIQNEALQVMKAFVAAYTERSAETPPAGPGPSGNGTAPSPEPEEPRVRDISID
ncbi:MAG: hypothetical protein WBW62_00835 [Solirubrobacterales bacterium]